MNTFLVLLIIMIAAGLIALVAFLIHKALHPHLKEEKPDPKAIAKEELDRVLVAVEDKETAEAISNYKNEEDE